MNTPTAPPSRGRVAALTAIALLAFAGNSLLCRLALKQSAVDATTFTSVRLIAGALTLALLTRQGTHGGSKNAGDWLSATALFVYAAGFSWAYVSLPAASGALLLFGAVQVTMIGVGLRRGERLRPRQTAGLVAAVVGLAALLLPAAQARGATAAPAPSVAGSLSMLCAGAAWGIYSLRGRGASHPLAVTAGNFRRASVLALLMSALMLPSAAWDRAGLAYAVASGALTSGVGYAVWYSALRGLTATGAATVQLTVPVIAALGAAALLGEPLTPRLGAASIVVLGGVAMVVVKRPRGSR